jgi:hypothetical protein
MIDDTKILNNLLQKKINKNLFQIETVSFLAIEYVIYNL